MEEGIKGFQGQPGGENGAHVACGGHVGAEGRQEHIADGKQRRHCQDDQNDGNDGIAQVEHLAVVQVL